MGWGEKKRIMVVFHDICQNHLHIQHQEPKSLNINTKLVEVEVAPPHFRPTPKPLGVLKKHDRVLSQTRSCFFKRPWPFKNRKFIQKEV
jgi:hypothetical protein